MANQTESGEQDEHLVPVFMPSLSTILLNHEQMKGSPLTEEEVLALRDGAVCMMMSSRRAAAMEERRGYRDLDPERCWDEFQQMKRQLQAQ